MEVLCKVQCFDTDGRFIYVQRDMNASEYPPKLRLVYEDQFGKSFVEVSANEYLNAVLNCTYDLAKNR